MDRSTLATDPDHGPANDAQAPELAGAPDWPEYEAARPETAHRALSRAIAGAGLSLLAIILTIGAYSITLGPHGGFLPLTWAPLGALTAETLVLAGFLVMLAQRALQPGDLERGTAKRLDCGVALPVAAAKLVCGDDGRGGRRLDEAWLCKRDGAHDSSFG